MSQTDPEEHARRATSFGAQAAAYARGRPEYPADALRFCLPDGARRVLDLGAGTGKLTVGLLALGLDVAAVEPLPEMRALIPPAATVLDGSAEAIPLPDAAVDAVLAGQAFHWFEREPALAEIARVLRPGGTIGLLWNFVDAHDPWSTAIAELMSASSHTIEAEPPYTDAPGLGDPECRRFRHERVVDADALVDDVASRSVVILMAPAERAERLARVRALAPAGNFRLPLVCVAWRGVRI